MLKLYNTLFIDMYGVILKESKGNFIPYTYNRFPETEHERISNVLKPLFTKAGLGEIDSNAFLSELGYTDPEFTMKDYIENHLTLDEGFIDFAEKIKGKYDLVLLSNDLSDWSKYITEFYGLDKYFKHKIISADVKCRKPNLEIFDKALEMIGKKPAECMFIDNSVKNLVAAEEVGIAPILFNRDKTHFYGMTVEDFNELYSLIG